MAAIELRRRGIDVVIVAARSPRSGQLIFVNGEQVGQVELQLPDEVPYRFAAIPQYATEEVLGAHLAGLGIQVHRGVAVWNLPTSRSRETALHIADKSLGAWEPPRTVSRLRTTSGVRLIRARRTSGIDRRR